LVWPEIVLPKPNELARILQEQALSQRALTFCRFVILFLVFLPGLRRMTLQKDDELAAIIQKRGVQPESNTSLWACLSRLVSHKDGGPIPVQTLAANAGIFFAAGFETTAHAISWALFELAADPTIQVCLFVCLPACLQICLYMLVYVLVTVSQTNCCTSIIQVRTITGPDSCIPYKHGCHCATCDRRQ